MRIGNPLRADVASRANERCEYCQYPEQFSPSSFEVEHIVPRSAGGLTELKNLALACSHCNAHKATRQKGIDPLTGMDVRLFNPRIDDWTVHFLLNRETGELEGKTSIGRTTVKVLQVNAEQSTGARRFLIGFGVL
jgi:5-methylcytosine-specific restriction endonuclease McrA